MLSWQLLLPSEHVHIVLAVTVVATIDLLQRRNNLSERVLGLLDEALRQCLSGSLVSLLMAAEALEPHLYECLVVA
jgi:hypothetical protein